MHLRMMPSSVASTLGFTWLGGTGCSLTCLSATAMASSPSKGTRPVAASYMTMPREYRSLVGPSSLPCVCSGET